ncbi:MAG: VOC family protein [Acidimicrobiales bacterium]
MRVEERGAVVNHVGLCTRDVEAALRFYVDLLEFELERDLKLPDGATADLLGVEPPVGLRAVYLRLGEVVLELLHYDRPGNPLPATRVMNEPGLTHLSICVQDLGAVVARVDEHGGTVVRDLLPMAVMVADPDGQILELLPMSYRQRIDSPGEA